MNDEGRTAPLTWHRTTVIGKKSTIPGVERDDRPGTCAACRRAFSRHSDEELHACAAAYERTEPAGPELCAGTTPEPDALTSGELRAAEGTTGWSDDARACS